MTPRDSRPPRAFHRGEHLRQAVTFNAAFTALGLANDMDKGIVDRFRSLPMPAMAVLLGRTLSDLTMSTVTLVVTSLCGLLVGWRITASPVDALLAYLLILLFAFAMSWVGAAIGLMARSVEVAQSAGLIWLFPVTFVSSAFVSTHTMPGPLRTIAEWNPVSGTATAVRQLFGNPPPAGLPTSDTWPVVHALPYAVVCACLITGAFMLLALRRFRRITLG